jgi:hypothetical protein
MKQHASLRTSAFVFALLISVAGFSQSSKSKKFESEPPLAAAKKFTNSSLAIATPDVAAAKPEAGTTLDDLKRTNLKLAYKFSKRFEKATEISIFPYEATTVFYCMEDGIRNNILYTNKGQWLHTVRYYDISKLPFQVYNQVKTEFPEYKMLRVSEVSTNQGIAYLVDIETMTMLKTIRVVDGNWDIYQQFDKQ